MLISDELRVLFVHVQKTGGSTIDKRLSAVVPDARQIVGLRRHSTLDQLLRAEPALSAYWSFGFVRNPWERMLSWYRMADRLRQTAAQDRPWSRARLERNPFLRFVVESCPDFETFVLEGTQVWPRLRRPQIAYLTSPTRRVDLIGRQETLEPDLRAVFARFELPWEPLVSVNVDRERPDYREVYSEAARRRVEEVFRADIDAFDYRF